MFIHCSYPWTHPSQTVRTSPSKQIRPWTCNKQMISLQNIFWKWLKRLLKRKTWIKSEVGIPLVERKVYDHVRSYTIFRLKVYDLLQCTILGFWNYDHLAESERLSNYTIFDEKYTISTILPNKRSFIFWKWSFFSERSYIFSQDR